MLGGLINLAFYGASTGGDIGNLFFSLESMGFFSYVLPFLLIFALSFAILNQIQIFGEQKGIYVVLALVVGFMSLQFGFVSYFFAELFPRMGVLLSIILLAVIVLGMFFDFKVGNNGERSNASKVLGGLMVVGIIVVLVQSFGSSFGLGGFGSAWGISYFLEKYLGAILIIILVVAGIGAVVGFKKPQNQNK